MLCHAFKKLYRYLTVDKNYMITEMFFRTYIVLIIGVVIFSVRLLVFILLTSQLLFGVWNSALITIHIWASTRVLEGQYGIPFI